MNKFLAGILAFLLWLFPWSGTIYGWHAQFSFDRNAVMNSIASCVAARDVASLESMLRPWFKENVSDLTDKITQFYASIDGNITNVNKGTAQGSSADGGIRSECLNFGVYTDDATFSHYYLIVWYDVSNSKNKKDVGIRSLQLSTGDFILDPDYLIHFELIVS